MPQRRVGGDVVSRAVVGDGDLDDQILPLKPGRHVHRDRASQKVLVGRAGHAVARDRRRVPPLPALCGEGKVPRAGRGHVTVLAGFPPIGIAVRAGQPLAERVVDQRVPKDAEVAGGTQTALPLQGRVGVFARGHVVVRPGKELRPFRRPAKLHRQHARHVRMGQAGGRVQIDAPELVAQIAGHTFGAHPSDQGGIGAVGCPHRRGGCVAGRAIAGRLGKIELVARAVIGFRRIRAQRRRAVVGNVGIPGHRAAAAANVGPLVHGEESPVHGRLRVGVAKPLVDRKRFLEVRPLPAVALATGEPVRLAHPAPVREPRVVGVVGGVVGMQPQRGVLASGPAFDRSTAVVPARPGGQRERPCGQPGDGKPEAALDIGDRGVRGGPNPDNRPGHGAVPVADAALDQRRPLRCSGPGRLVGLHGGLDLLPAGRSRRTEDQQQP